MFNLVSVQTGNVARNLAKNQSLTVRTFKATCEIGKVKWERPQHPTRYSKIRSGDLGKYEVPDQTQICVKYQYATELEK